MCCSFYLCALAAVIEMGRTLGHDIEGYRRLLAQGKKFLEAELYNGEYFFQKVMWRELHAQDPAQAKSGYATYAGSDSRRLLEAEGPHYQYADGCLSDGVLGEWLAACCGLDGVLDPQLVRSHLAAVFRHNFKDDLWDHANTQRITYANGHEGGLLLCTWPRGGKPTLPFIYSDEVWTGIEYQAASHMMMMGLVSEGLRIVRAARDRYDGRVRNPYDEYECGHWYARALASYGLLQGLTGQRYDAVDRILYLRPVVTGDFVSFISTATGYGNVGVKDGRPFLKVVAGRIDVDKIVCPG
jgi:Glycosyl-hydrolase family 116, catalytic region